MSELKGFKNGIKRSARGDIFNPFLNQRSMKVDRYFLWYVIGNMFQNIESKIASYMTHQFNFIIN